ncbi:MAG: A/G-specific adenine glycosylase [Prevotella sp.]|nr:A/G-specific adenine glycosylase [Prevotella sp.]
MDSSPCSFASVLLNWFSENGRELPWRETQDPYAIWLSEIILQQTRIQQGWAYWERFMQSFPRVEDLAAASEDEVMRLWQGLGYYSRARNLHAAARQIVERGGFPQTFDEIKTLKGVGDYTAAAIASIAFGQPVAVVDGNVYRVLARHFGIDTPINSTEGKKLFASLAQELLPKAQPSAFNQAMMDFGAIHCTPQSPRCLLCPLAETCDALHKGRVEELPVKLKTVKVKTRRLTYIYVRCHGETAFHRREAGDIWQGLWEPLLVSDSTTPNPSSKGGDGFEGAAPVLPTCLGGEENGTLTLLRKDVKHVLTHRILLTDFYLFECNKKPTLPAGYLWIPESELENYAVPRLIEILLSSLR